MLPSQLKPAKLYEALIKNGVSYFCGVPDSLLSSFSFYLEDYSKESHDIAVNEGNALALAIGHYLATEQLALVYMQNSGLGNAINPLVSLADPLVMGIPMILLIGWRGQAGKTDEPQHKKQGLITAELLEKLDIPYLVLASNGSKVRKQVAEATNDARKHQRPFALLVEANTFPSAQKTVEKSEYPLSREEVIGVIVTSLNKTDVIVATTGKASRELFELREISNQEHAPDLLIVGGMGHASTIALAIAHQKQNRKIFCIDGDGAVLMHLGALASIGVKALKNYYHFVINNGSHESVGGQPTIAFDIDIPAIAKACGYKVTHQASNKAELEKVIKAVRKKPGPVLVEIRVNNKSRPNLIRPTVSPAENKRNFIEFLKD